MYANDTSELVMNLGWISIFILTHFLILSLVRKRLFVECIERFFPCLFRYIVTATTLTKIKTYGDEVSYYSLVLKRYIKHERINELVLDLKTKLEVLIPMALCNIIILIIFILYCPVYTEL